MILEYRYDLFEAPLLPTGEFAPRTLWRSMISVESLAVVVFNAYGLITAMRENCAVYDKMNTNKKQGALQVTLTASPAMVQKQNNLEEQPHHKQNKCHLYPPPACRPLLHKGSGTGQGVELSNPVVKLSPPAASDFPTVVSFNHQNAQESHPPPFCGIPYPHHPWQHASLNADGHPVGSSYACSQPLRRGDSRLDGRYRTTPPPYSLAGVSVVGAMREQVDPGLCLGGPLRESIE